MEIASTDIVPLDAFSLSWRWTDKKWNELPAEALKTIRPISVAKAGELHEFLKDFHSEHGLKVENFVSVERFLAPWSEIDKVSDQLRTRLRASDNDLAVSWDAKTAVMVSKEVFVEYWDDFCYPSSDDVDVLPLSHGWMLAYFHDEYFEFGRSGS
jgi:hypothetical protein